MNLASTFSGMPGATELPGVPDAWHWSLAPGFDFVAGLTPDGEHAFQAYALDSYDEALAVALLSFARADSSLIASAPIVIAEGFSAAGYKFDVVGAVGPSVHKYPAKAEPEVHEATRALFPAYRCEFAGDETEEETQYRYARAAGVPVTRWRREPRPYLKLRYRTESGRDIPERGFAGLPTLVHELRSLEGHPDGFVEFEKYRHEVWRVECNGAWVLSGESADPRNLGIDELLDVTKATLYGPNLDAGDSEFTKQP